MEYIEVESINIPYVGSYSLGLFYIPLAAGVIVATTSAVAVSDGMDGLAGGDAHRVHRLRNRRLHRGQEFVATFAFIIAGSTLGFLWYNAHPARVIMGDTGALALGSSLAVIALMTASEGCCCRSSGSCSWPKWAATSSRSGTSS